LFNVNEPVVFVIEQSRIDALSPEMFKELLGLAAINKEKLHIVIPDMREARDSARRDELRQLGVQIHGDLPEVAKLPNVQVIGFSDTQEDIGTFKARLGQRIAGRTSAYFGTGQAGNFAVALLFALRNIRRSELLERNGYLFGTARLMEQALQTLWNAFTVISSAA
jgi:hypothetical protein